MSSQKNYHLTVKEDTLEVNFDLQCAPGDLLVKEVDAYLDELINTQQLSGGSLLKIYGRISLLLSYTIAHKVAHLYSAIAVFDPRLQSYVVVISSNQDYPMSSRIDLKTGEVKMVLPSSNSEEPSFLMYWKDNILQAHLNPKVQFDGDEIVRDVFRQLDKLEQFASSLRGKLLRINGRASVLSSFILANHFAHVFGAIAVNDPKIATEENDKYVVVISHDQDYSVGQTIDIPNKTLSVKAVICGSPNTGKTCLREGLKQALNQLVDIPNYQLLLQNNQEGSVISKPFYPESYVISGCPDGDYSWFPGTMQNYPELEEKLKSKYKAGFTPDFARNKARDIKAIKTPILVFDVGGKISKENEIIMQEATHSIILAKTETEVAQWREFCHKLGLPIIAIIMSDLKATSDEITDNYPPLLQGRVHRLERGENVGQRPMIQALAQLLCHLSRENSSL